MSARTLRPLVRLARRDVLRHPLRTALLTFVIALPVALITMIHISTATSAGARDRGRIIDLGDARSRFDVFDLRGADPATLAADGDVTLEQRLVVIDIGGAERGMVIEVGNVFDPLIADKFTLRQGRPASNGHEVMVSDGMRRRFDLHVGDRLSVGTPSTDVQVVGVYADRGELRRQTLSSVAADYAPVVEEVRLFSPTPLADRSLDVGGYQTYDADGYFGDAVGVEVRFAIQVAVIVGLMALALLITAAFASGARRQLREVGLIASNGADPRTVRRAFALQGTLTAVTGVVIGWLIVAVIGLTMRDRVRWWSNQDVQFGIAKVDMVVSMAAVVTAGTLAAWWPAKSVARTPILSALAGRRPVSSVSPALPIAGLVCGAIGIPLIASGTRRFQWATIMAGAGLVIVAVTLCSAWLVSVTGRLLARRGGVMRIGGRGLARQRTRTGPLVASMALSIALAVLGITVAATESAHAAQDREYSSSVASLWWDQSQDDVSDAAVSASIDEVIEAAPGAVALATSNAYYTYDDGSLDVYLQSTSEFTADSASWYSTLFVDPSLLPPGGLRAALEDGMVVTSGTARPFDVNVVTYPTYADDAIAVEPVTERIGTFPAVKLDDPLLDVVAADGEAVLVDMHRVRSIIEGAMTLDLVPVEAWSVNFYRSHGLTAAEMGTLEDLARHHRDERRLQQALGNGAVRPEIYVDTSARSEERANRWLMIGLVGATALMTLIAIGFGMSLSRVEQRDDDDVLQALGARPTFRRHLARFEAGVLTALAVVIAVPLGLLVAFVVRNGISDRGTVVPWNVLMPMSVGLPLMAVIVFGMPRRAVRRVDLQG